MHQLLNAYTMTRGLIFRIVRLFVEHRTPPSMSVSHRICRPLALIAGLLLWSTGKSQDGNDAPFQLPQDPPDYTAGQIVEWEGWSFRWQFRDIEGLMLNDVYFQGRKVLKSINLSEIYVPYAPGAPRPEDFSFGGFLANPMPLEIGRDCNSAGTGCKPFNRDGSAATGTNADVMMHEEPTGFAYAGTQGRAPGKMLVLWSMVHFKGTDDGYTYVVKWKFRNDGSICPEVGATGGLQHLNIGAGTDAGVVVGKDAQGEEVFAPSHVHNFYFRIDFDIDGADSNVAEEFTYEPDSTDPQIARAVWRPFERETGRVLSENVFRSWRVKNPKSLNAIGRPRSYHLMPGGHGAWKDGGFPVCSGDFFITKFRASEFPYSATDNRRMLSALSNYLNDEAVVETDVVAWYRLSFVHHPRAEDWPAQPIVWNSFELMPRDFLDASPLKPKK